MRFTSGELTRIAVDGVTKAVHMIISLVSCTADATSQLLLHSLKRTDHVHKGVPDPMIMRSTAIAKHEADKQQRSVS